MEPDPPQRRTWWTKKGRLRWAQPAGIHDSIVRHITGANRMTERETRGPGEIPGQDDKPVPADEPAVQREAMSPAGAVPSMSRALLSTD